MTTPVTWPAPYLLKFPKLGEPGEGWIAVGEEGTVPFPMRRSFWTYDTPDSILRGRHAHYQTQQVLVAAVGRIIVTVEHADRRISTFWLEDPAVGLYLPPNVWRTMQYAPLTLQIVVASTLYEEADYIRDYKQFRQVWG